MFDPYNHKKLSKTKEVWKYVELKGIVRLRYKVSNTGKVFDELRREFLKVSYDEKTGFLKFSLRKINGTYKSFLAHRLMFEVFEPEKFKEAADKKWLLRHADGNVRNNDLDNIEPVPASVARRQRTQEISKLSDKKVIKGDVCYSVESGED